MGISIYLKERLPMLFPEEREKYNENIPVPEPSFTQMEVYRALFRRCFDDNRFEGPASELRCGRTSLDIVFLGRNGEKICYEIDCKKFHKPEEDKIRDGFVKSEFHWKVFRVDVRSVDNFGVEEIAEMMFQHLLKQLGYSGGLILPNIITSYTERNIH